MFHIQHSLIDFGSLECIYVNVNVPLTIEYKNILIDEVDNKILCNKETVLHSEIRCSMYGLLCLLSFHD